MTPRAQAQLDLEPIKTREAAATKGPWRTFFAEDIAVEESDTGEWIAHLGDECDGHEPDAHFIAHARQDIPALIAEVERLREAALSAPARTADYEEYAPTLERLIHYKTEPGIADAYLYHLTQMDLEEHGGSVPGWLTEKGHRAIMLIDKWIEMNAAEEK